MEKEDAFKRIQRYLGRSDTHPRLVNANNPVDLDAVCDGEITLRRAGPS